MCIGRVAIASPHSPIQTARMTSEKFPEQYPAVKDQWAEPVDSDNKEMAIVRPLLKNTNLEKRALKLSYSANRNGWNAAAFHKNVDRKGGALVVCTTQDGLLCGGYNPKGVSNDLLCCLFYIVCHVVLTRLQ